LTFIRVLTKYIDVLKNLNKLCKIMNSWIYQIMSTSESLLYYLIRYNIFIIYFACVN